MNNNDVLRRVRYAFDLNDDKVIACFAHADVTVSRTQVCAWLKKDDDDDRVELADVELASFLNGFIIEKRGRRDGPQPAPEKQLTNNLILAKLKIALALRAEDVLAMIKAGGMTISKPELTALFRKPGSRQFRPAKDQVVRYFLRGMTAHHRPQPNDDDDT